MNGILAAVIDFVALAGFFAALIWRLYRASDSEDRRSDGPPA